VLRSYLEEKRPEEAAAEIEELETIRELNIVLAANPRGAAYWATVSKLKELRAKL